MPFGYLWTVVLPAVAVIFALIPTRRTWLLGQLSWRLGFQVNELPFLVSIWLIAATALAGLQGDLATTLGKLGAALAALTLVGLALIVRRSLQARPAVFAALSEGLGDQWTAELTDASRGGVRRSLPWRLILLTPFAMRRKDVVQRRNLAYGGAGSENRLDLYQPKVQGADRPCLIHFHGGGYRSGRKSREARALIGHLVRQGWVCVSANYQLSPRVAYPAPLIDAKRVIAWTREHAPEYGIDPAAIFIAGSSAGAHLAALAALTPGSAALQPGFEEGDTSVAAAICLYGFYGSPHWIACEPGLPAAPTEEVHSAAPPFLVVHGEKDSFVPAANARDFLGRLRTVSTAPVVYAELPGAQHTFDLYHSIRFESVIDGIEAFTRWVRSTN